MRKQFTFYSSFYDAVSRIKNEADRLVAYETITKYALTGIEPDYDTLPDSVAMVMILCKPTMDTSRRRSETGASGGTNSKKSESIPENFLDAKNDDFAYTSCSSKMSKNAKNENANDFAYTSCVSEKEKEKEIEVEIEKELEGECEGDFPSQTARKRAKSAKTPYGEYGWVRLSEEEHGKLVADFGTEKVCAAICAVDEAAQRTKNKNRWKDWYLTVRTCIRDNWGSYARKLGTSQDGNGDTLSPLARRAVEQALKEVEYG